NVPFEEFNNPEYIQNIIDTYFDIIDGVIFAKSSLFEELEHYYTKSRKNNRSSEWFGFRAEWIKFSYDDQHNKTHKLGYINPCDTKYLTTSKCPYILANPTAESSSE
ncbi:unnamed protein product, partial [marine sediment metagenome]